MNEQLSAEQQELLQDINTLIKNSYTFISAMDTQRALVSPDTNVDNARESIKATLEVMQEVNPSFY